MPAPRRVLLPPRRTKPAKGPTRRYVIARIKPTGVSPSPGIEMFAERFEAKFRGGHALHKPLMPEAIVPTIVTIPRKQTAGSITDEQVKDLHATLTTQTLGDREAVVACENMVSENAARGRARSLGDRYADDYATLPVLDDEGNPTGETKVNPHRFLSAHAIPDPNNEGKWLGAVSVRTDQTDPATKPKPAPKAKPAAKTPPVKP